MSVLALDVAGTPRHWIEVKTAIEYHAKNAVVWSLGDIMATYHGGYQNNGKLSVISTPSIIAIRGKGFDPALGKVLLNNKTLFGRDRHTCAYCGNYFHNTNLLSRDHIIPLSKGGPDTWMNVVTSCKPCNARKGSKSLKEAKMELLYIPYVPNYYEHLLLQRRNVCADQMDYLKSGLPKYSRLLAA